MEQWLDKFALDKAGTCVPGRRRECNPVAEDNCKEGYYAHAFKRGRICRCECKKKN